MLFFSGLFIHEFHPVEYFILEEMTGGDGAVSSLSENEVVKCADNLKHFWVRNEFGKVALGETKVMEL